MTDTGSAAGECTLEPAARLEAVLMTADRPVSDAKLGEAADIPDATAATITSLVAALNETYEETSRVFRVVRVASGWQVMTIPEAAPVLARILDQRKQSRLSPAAMETLSIIAYRQPVMRAEIEAIRGVACGEVLRTLLERRMIRIAGRAEELGRPMLYGTTKDFLQIFGLSGIDDLPEVEGLQRGHTRVGNVKAVKVDAAPEPEQAVAEDSRESDEPGEEAPVAEDATT